MLRPGDSGSSVVPGGVGNFELNGTSAAAAAAATPGLAIEFKNIWAPLPQVRSRSAIGPLQVRSRRSCNSEETTNNYMSVMNTRQN